MSRRRVDVRIDELVLRGFTPAQREVVAASLRAEFERLLSAAAKNGEFQRDESAASVRLGQVRAPQTGFAEHVGRLAARGVAREMPR